MDNLYSISTPGLGLPRGREFWTDPAWAEPLYSPGQIARQFFNRTVRWLNMARQKHAITDAVLAHGIVKIETPNGQAPWRRYRLHHIEQLTHELLRNRVIDGERAVAALSIVKATAVLHGHGAELRRIEEEFVREQEALTIWRAERDHR